MIGMSVEHFLRWWGIGIIHPCSILQTRFGFCRLMELLIFLLCCVLLLLGKINAAFSVDNVTKGNNKGSCCLSGGGVVLRASCSFQPYCLLSIHAV